MRSIEYRPQSIVLASKSEHKVGSVHDAYYSVFGQNLPGLITYDPDSGVWKQPEDLMTIQGAYNRLYRSLAMYQNEFGTEPDVVIVIESGLFNERSGQLRRIEPVDRAVVIVRSPVKEVLAFSDPIPFPIRAVQATRRLPGGFENNTVGETLSRWYGWEHNDWQNRITQGRMPRRLQMAQPIEEGLRALYIT